MIIPHAGEKMRNDSQWKTILSGAAELGYENAEFYVESTHTASVRYFGRTDEVRFHHRQGASLRAIRKGVAHRFFADSAEPETWLSLLQTHPYRSPALPKAFAEQEEPALHPPKELIAATTELLQKTRGVFSSASTKWAYTDIEASLSLKEYALLRWDSPEGKPAFGKEECADFKAQWKPELAYSWERSRGSIQGLLSELDSSFVPTVKASLQPLPAWPAPQGPLPVLWSARSVAKLQMHLLYALEGDHVLDERSFLNTHPLPLSFRFDLEDRPPASAQQTDHEGSVRRALSILKEGRPTALACHARIAQELEVHPTGHGRRESFDSPVTTGFWHAFLQAKNQKPSLLGEMTRGVSVRDLEIVDFDLTTAKIRLRLTDCRLVHHGQEGEPIEEMVVDTDLVALLESFVSFDQTLETTGMAQSKQQQKIYTELTVPAALSEAFPFPGSVPPDHYW